MSAETCVDCGCELSLGGILSGDDQCSICWSKARAGAASTPAVTAATPRTTTQAQANNSDEAEIQAYLSRMVALDRGAQPVTQPQPRATAGNIASASEEDAHVARMVALDNAFLAARAAARATEAP